MFKTTLQENPHQNEQKTNILNRCSIPSSALSIMRYSLGTLLLALSQGIYADCGWRLNGNDCICMNSANGNAWTEWTSYCCQAMGRRTGGFVSESLVQFSAGSVSAGASFLFAVPAIGDMILL